MILPDSNKAKSIHWIIVVSTVILLIITILIGSIGSDNKPWSLLLVSGASWLVKIRIFLPELFSTSFAVILAFISAKSQRLESSIALVVVYLLLISAFSHDLSLELFNSVRIIDFVFFSIFGFYIGNIIKYCLVTKNEFNLFWKSLLLYIVLTGFYSLPGPNPSRFGLLQTIGFVSILVLYPIMILSALTLPINTIRIILQRKEAQHE